MEGVVNMSLNVIIFSVFHNIIVISSSKIKVLVLS